MQERQRKMEDLARTYGTDKLAHGYFESYAQHLPDTCRSLLEIGVAKGASLKLWNEVFGRSCEIEAIDLFEDQEHVGQRWCRRWEFVPYKGDQSDINFLYTIKNQYQIIIDDGSHNADHQQISFKHLFVNNLRSGGLYVIEDLHCCKEEFYWNTVKSFEDTALSLFQNYKKTGKLSNLFFNEGQGDIYQGLISRVELCCDDKIVFIWRR